MHACKAAPPTTSSRAFSLRYHRSGNFVVDRTNVITDPTSPNCHVENGRRERVALLLANNAGSLAGCRRSLPSHPFSLFSPRHPLSHSFSLSLSLLLPLTRLAPSLTWSPRQRTAVFLSPHCVSQGCCLFCSSIVRIHQRIHSFCWYCLTAALARVRSVSPPTFLSIATDRLHRYVGH